MMHGTLKSFNAGCECDGCRLGAYSIVKARSRARQRGQVRRQHRASPRLGMELAASYRTVLLAVLADSPLRLVAEFTGLSMSTLSMIARGEVTEIRRDTANALRRLPALLPEEASR